MRKDNYLPTYAENVFPAGREALTTGKFHDMFMAGDGHELEDYTDKNGRLHPAHARAINSSSMLAYNFFHWVSPEHPLTLHGTRFDKVYFEVKFPVMAKTSEGRPVNRPSNMDVVLISDDCRTMWCIESKYTEYTHNQQAIFSDAYFKPECYYDGNPYRTEFIRLALRYNEESNGYYAGIKQNVSHLLGITNIMHDADALAWFKANNSFIEPKVMRRLSSHKEIIFTNLLYTRPELKNHIYGDNIPPREDETKVYPYLLGELVFDHLWESIDEPLLLSHFIETYPQLFEEVKDQMPPRLADYLDDRYVLTVPPKFPLPEGYDTADHYLTDLVLRGANERYIESFTPEVTERIKSELAIIRHRGWANRFLIAWDCVRAAREELGVYVGPGRSSTAGSIVTYCLGITDVEPLSAELSAEGLLQRVSLPDFAPEFSSKGKEFVLSYLLDKYGAEYASRFSVSEYSVLDIAEQTIAATGESIDFRTLPYDSPELLQFFLTDPDWRQYSYFGGQDMEALRDLKCPTFEEMVHIFSIRTFFDGSSQVVPREHSYARCVLFLRLAWLKKHHPEAFCKALIHTGLASGFDTLDSITGGWHPSDFVVIGGRPAMGKTSLMLSMAVKMADEGTPVAIFSLEMSTRQLVKRLIMNVCSVGGSKLRSGKLTREDWSAIDQYLPQLKSDLIYFDEASNLSISELVLKARHLVCEKGVKCIFIDYIQLMTIKDVRFGNRAAELSIISHELKDLAKKLGVPIVALSQLNRALESRTGIEGKVPQLRDIRESKAIEQIADVICLIHRPEYYYRQGEQSEGYDPNEVGKAHIIVAKNVHGPLGEAILRFNQNCAKFENL